MISYAGHKDPLRLIRLAVFDDVAPLEHGTVFEYWRGETDLNPHGLRKQVFQYVMYLCELGRLDLRQRNIGDGIYSYQAKVL